MGTASDFICDSFGSPEKYNPTTSSAGRNHDSLIKGVARRASIHGQNMERLIRDSFHTRSLTLRKNHKSKTNERRQSYNNQLLLANHNRNFSRTTESNEVKINGIVKVKKFYN